MYDHTKLVKDVVWKELMKRLPTPRQRRLGRKRAKKESLLNGILQVLINGVSWEKIADCGCSYVTCFRYLRRLQQEGYLKLIYQSLAKEKTNLKVGSMDTTTIPSFEFKAVTGFNGQKRILGTKISLYADINGLPADVGFDKGSVNDKQFILAHLANTYGKGRRILNLDMSYMNLSLRRELRKINIRVNMKVRAQDFRRKKGPKFKFDQEKYALRFLVERLNGWIKNFKRVRFRRDYHISSFKAFVYLALIIILLRF